MRELKNIVVFTDVKYDDVVALHILINATPRDSFPITVVVTNVEDKERASGLLMHFFGQVITVQSDGSTGGSPKSHEIMFARHSPYALTVFDPNTSYDNCFMLAPIIDTCKETLRRSKITFMGLGYNTHACGIDKDFIEGLPTVVLMNNMSPTIYPEGEGGRFAANDDEIWRHCDELYGGGIKLLREDALADSRAFMLRQIAKSGINSANVGNLFDDITLKLCQTCTTPNHYMERIIDQLKRKTVDVETTDAQHMALWLHTSSISPVKLVEGPKFLEIHEIHGSDDHTSSSIFAPCGITLASMRDAFTYGTNIKNMGIVLNPSLFGVESTNEYNNIYENFLPDESMRGQPVYISEGMWMYPDGRMIDDY